MNLWMFFFSYRGWDPESLFTCFLINPGMDPLMSASVK
jgi:hypothetical protein